MGKKNTRAVYSPTVGGTRFGAQLLYYNRSERFRKVFSYIDDGETLGNWSSWWGVAPSADTTNFVEGSQGIKLTTTAGADSCMVKSFSPSINCRGYHFELWIYIDDITKLDWFSVAFFEPTITRGWLYDTSGLWGFPAYPVVPLRTGWNKLILSRANFYPQGGATEADWANIGLVRIIVASVAGQTVSCTFDDFRMVQDRFAGKVTLRFDDVFLSIYTEARERMDAYGFRGVAPVFIDAVGTEGKMTLSQLAHLQERGWDIVSHSLTHADLTALTLGEVDRELRVSQEWLIERGFYKGSRFFVPPYHKWEPWVIDLVSKYYLGCQTVVSEPTQGAGHDTLPPFDPLHMMVREVWNTTTVATVQGWIDDCIRTQSWLTILFHNLVSPAGAQYEYTPADFQSIIDYLYTNGVEVVTFSDVFDDLMGAKFGFSHTQLLEFGVQGAITPNATSYPCPGGGVAAQTATEIRVPISRAGWLKNLRVRQRVASGAAGRTDIYTVRVNGVDTALTCTLDNATVGSDLVHSAFVSPGDLVSVSLVSNNVADASADVSVTVELEVLM